MRIAHRQTDEEKVRFRQLLVGWGDARRKIQSDYQIEQVANQIAYLGSAINNFIVTDVRYRNEAEWIKSMGGQLILVTRPGLVPANETEAVSISEIPLELFSHKVVNSGTLEDLKNATNFMVPDKKSLECL